MAFQSHASMESSHLCVQYSDYSFQITISVMQLTLFKKQIVIYQGVFLK